jgi:hypothetical protein
MCDYLYAVDPIMDKVDPILRNNAGLVERLADLEEAWEMVMKYVEDAGMRCALDAVCSTLTSLQKTEPMFLQMCSGCDAELFLVIPRLILLAFLLDPTKDALMKTLLPCKVDLSASGSYCTWKTLVHTFEGNVRKSPDFADFLVCQVLHGPGAEETNEFIPKELQDIIRGFMRDLEYWSLELQRHKASDWNAFCALLVQHLDPDHKKDRRVEEDCV